MMLGYIDDERKASLIRQERRQHRGAPRIARALDLADLVQPDRFRQHRLGDAVAAEGFKRAGERRSRLGIAGKSLVLF